MCRPERLIPLDEAADCLGLTTEALTELIASGKIKANIHKGEILVPENEIGRITREQFKKLKGKPITIMQAVEKYNVPYTTLIGWVKSDLELITILKPGYRMQLDESDVAYCAAVYEARGRTSRLFDELGRPYTLKRPDLKAYRERVRKSKKKPDCIPA